MKTVDRYLCASCAQDMRKLGMLFARAKADEESEQQKCAFCGKPCFFGKTYRIFYDRRK